MSGEQGESARAKIVRVAAQVAVGVPSQAGAQARRSPLLAGGGLLAALSAAGGGGSGGSSSASSVAPFAADFVAAALFAAAAGFLPDVELGSGGKSVMADARLEAALWKAGLEAAGLAAPAFNEGAADFAGARELFRSRTTADGHLIDDQRLSSMQFGVPGSFS